MKVELYIFVYSFTRVIAPPTENTVLFLKYEFFTITNLTNLVLRKPPAFEAKLFIAVTWSISILPLSRSKI